MINNRVINVFLDIKGFIPRDKNKLSSYSVRRNKNIKITYGVKYVVVFRTSGNEVIFKIDFMPRVTRTVTFKKILKCASKEQMLHLRNIQIVRSC